MIKWRINAPTESTREVVCEEGWPQTLDDVFRLGAERYMFTLAPAKRSDPSSRLLFVFYALALRATVQGVEPIMVAGCARHERSVAEFTALYTEAMSCYGMRLRGTYTMTQFTTDMAALGEGFALQTL